MVYAGCNAELTEVLPSTMQHTREEGFTMNAFVDSDHVGDLVTRKSQPEYFVYLQH